MCVVSSMVKVQNTVFFVVQLHYVPFFDSYCTWCIKTTVCSIRYLTAERVRLHFVRLIGSGLRYVVTVVYCIMLDDFI